jgi:ketosteroid isomerase-like protein
MSEESTTPDLVELRSRMLEVTSSRNIDAILRFYAPDAVYENTAVGMDTYHGHAEIRTWLEDWFGSYEEVEIAAEEILDLGNGVVFSVVIQNARPVGSSGEVRMRYAAVTEWVNGLVVRVMNYLEPDIDEARAAAERLAEERG